MTGSSEASTHDAAPPGQRASGPGSTGSAAPGGAVGTASPPGRRHEGGLLALCVATLGVVYGDIGTSPLYTVSEVFFGQGAVARTPENAIGAASLILWILTISVFLKYVLLVLRADHHGQGGTFALLALIRRSGGRLARLLSVALVLAAGLLYGEGVITPAISVLSAVEGLRVATRAFEPYIVPITVVVLLALFAIQRRGTARVGTLFGPAIAVWFVVIAVLGVAQVVAHPGILAAASPLAAARFLAHGGGLKAMAVLGAVLLAVTGCEALFADLGHFGRRPIQITWTWLVYPSLMLNYLGQGAYILGGGPVAHGHVFYALVPSWALYPMVALATFATVIASQALISGAFSLTSQAIALGLFPRLRIIHTSGEHEGQIYVPALNWVLLAASSLLVVGFGSSSNLAAAYGFAVSGVMVVTSLSMVAIATRVWGWRWRKALPVFGLFALIELAFFGSASLKVLHGGWVPLAIGWVVYATMSTWNWGRMHIARRYAAIAPTCETVEQLARLKADPAVPQIPRSIVVMSSRPIVEAQDRIPPVLHLFFSRLGALPRHVVFLTVQQEQVPYQYLLNRRRFDATTFTDDPTTGSVTSIRASYGYMETPDVRKALTKAKEQERIKVPGDPRRWLVIVGQENVVDSAVGLLVRLRLSFFRLLLRNSVAAHLYFGLGADTHVTTETVHIEAGAFAQTATHTGPTGRT